MSKSVGFRTVVFICISLVGCSVFGLAGPTAEITVLSRGGPVVEDSAYVVGTSPVGVQGVLQTVDCVKPTARVRESVGTVSLMIGVEPTDDDDCHTGPAWIEYRATLRGLAAGPRTLHVIHDASESHPPDTVLTRDVVIAQ